MTATQRNQLWVKNGAWDIGARKSGLAKYCFTVGEVVEVLGFSRNTVKKYVALLEEQGIIREIVLSKSITIYKFSKEAIADNLEYLDQMASLATYGEGS